MQRGDERRDWAGSEGMKMEPLKQKPPWIFFCVLHNQCKRVSGPALEKGSEGSPFSEVFSTTKQG